MLIGHNLRNEVTKIKYGEISIIMDMEKFKLK